ncbi:MAG: hypothetical protein OXH02_04650 [Gemmatimonadetes bacterium]|nr:hypothetical protein [Gemmatimonadota bacterium]
MINTSISDRRSYPIGRQRLSTVLQDANEVIETDDVVKTLSVTRIEASKLLSRWTGQGWLRRVGRGTYVAVPLGLLGSRYVLDDHWVLVPSLYGSSYIGGWTAAEYWDLTEQLFNDTVVMTSIPVRQKQQIRHGARFLVFHTHQRKVFGTKTVWRGCTRVPLSDIHRTIIDMLDNPKLGGGIQHVSDCLGEYLKKPERSDESLKEYAKRIGNGAVLKRLGFLMERLSGPSKLSKWCQERMTTGNARIDSALNCTRLVTKWRLWVPPNW